MSSPGMRRQGMFGRTPSSACIQNYIASALMDEQQKHAILYASTILCARKLIEMDPYKPIIHGARVRSSWTPTAGAEKNVLSC